MTVEDILADKELSDCVRKIIIESPLSIEDVIYLIDGSYNTNEDTNLIIEKANKGLKKELIKVYLITNRIKNILNNKREIVSVGFDENGLNVETKQQSNLEWFLDSIPYINGGFVGIANVNESEKVIGKAEFTNNTLSNKEIVEKLKEQSKGKRKEFTINGTFEGENFPTLIEIGSKLSELGFFNIEVSINEYL